MRLTLGRYSARLRERKLSAIGGIASDILVAIALGYIGYTSVSEIILFDLHRLGIFLSVSPALGTAPFAVRVLVALVAILLYYLAMRFSDQEETLGERLLASVIKGLFAPRTLVSAFKSKLWPFLVEATNLLREYFGIDSESFKRLTSSFRISPSNARFIPWLLFFVAWVLILGGVFIAANLGSFATVPVIPHPFAPPVSVPQISIYLALLALTLGWTGLLTGATLTNMGVLLLVVLFYLINFPRVLYSSHPQLHTALQYGYATVFWTFPLLGALASATPINMVIRFITLWGLCALATWMTAQAIQTNLIFHTEAYLAWIAASEWVTAGEIFFSLAAAGALSLVTTRLSAVLVFVTILSINLASIAVYLGMGAYEETINVRAAAAYIQVHAAQVRIWTDVVWFALGLTILDFAVNFSRRTVHAVRRGLAAQWWPTALFLLCLAELVVLARYLQLPFVFSSGGEVHFRISFFYLNLWQHTVITLLVLAAASALITTRRFTVEWALALCGVWAFTFFVFRMVYGSGEEVGLLVVGTLLWELLKGVSRLTPTNSKPKMASGLLMIYLGALVVLSAMIHFDLVAPSQFVPSSIGGGQIGGFEALSLPIMVYWLLARYGHANEFRRKQYVRALILGGLVSCVAYAVRGHFGDPGQISMLGNLSLLAFAQTLILLTALVTIRLDRAAEPVDAAVVGLGCAFGFAVGTTFGLLPFAGGLLLFFTQVLPLAGDIGVKWLAIPSPSYADLFVFNTITPVVTCIALLLLHGKRQTGPGWVQWLGAFSFATVMLIYVAPVYQGNFLWTAPPKSGVIPDMRAFLYLGFAMLCGVYYIYKTLTRDVGASGVAGTASTHSAQHTPSLPAQ